MAHSRKTQTTGSPRSPCRRRTFCARTSQPPPPTSIVPTSSSRVYRRANVHRYRYTAKHSCMALIFKTFFLACRYSTSWKAFGEELTEFSATIGTCVREGSAVVTVDRRLVDDGQVRWSGALQCMFTGRGVNCCGARLRVASYSFYHLNRMNLRASPLRL
jgi:hypothetical protein